MENVDYIIVGAGFAGMFLAHRLLQNGEQFKIFSHGNSASEVSAGIANPVVLKKFTTFWLAGRQLEYFRKTIGEIEGYTAAKLLIEEPVRRIFHDEKERALWLRKSSDAQLESFLGKEFRDFDEIINPFGTGEVLQSARLDVPAFFSAMKAYLKGRALLVEEKFDYQELDAARKTYADQFKFNKIIFAEGIGVRENPFFKNIPLEANKGHRILVKFDTDIEFSETFKKKHFLFPWSDGVYYYGGTYARHWNSDEVDEGAVEQLKDGLGEIYGGKFQIAKEGFGMRPTVRDRRPILGESPDFPGCYVFNGLGARGVLNGCWFSEPMYQFVVNGRPLPPEVSLDRFCQI